MITLNSGPGARPAIRFEHTPRTRSPRPLSHALPKAARAAFGLMSIAVTLAAPARAAASERMPLPQPTSAACLPERSSPPRKVAKNLLVRNTLGWIPSAHGQPKPGDLRDAGTAAAQEQVIRPEMNERADQPPEQALPGPLSKAPCVPDCFGQTPALVAFLECALTRFRDRCHRRVGRLARRPQRGLTR